jgi:hypothetical protein
MLFTAMLLLAQVVTSAGCVYVPMFGKPVSGTHTRDAIRRPESMKRLNPSTATEADVIALLGEPKITTTDRQVFVYPWIVQNGLTIYPLFLAADPVYGRRTLVVRFDERGVVRSREVLRADDPIIKVKDVGGFPLPPEVEAELKARRRAATSRAATRPTREAEW